MTDLSAIGEMVIENSVHWNCRLFNHIGRRNIGSQNSQPWFHLLSLSWM